MNYSYRKHLHLKLLHIPYAHYRYHCIHSSVWHSLSKKAQPMTVKKHWHNLIHCNFRTQKQTLVSTNNNIHSASVADRQQRDCRIRHMQILHALYLLHVPISVCFNNIPAINSILTCHSFSLYTNKKLVTICNSLATICNANFNSGCWSPNLPLPCGTGCWLLQCYIQTWHTDGPC